MRNTVDRRFICKEIYTICISVIKKWLAQKSKDFQAARFYDIWRKSDNQFLAPKNPDLLSLKGI